MSSELAQDLAAALDGETEIVVRWPEDPPAELGPGDREVVLTWGDLDDPWGGDGE